MLHAELRVIGGKQQGKVLPLNVKNFLIGREEDCQLRPNSDLVSRHHCVFTNDAYTLRLRDLGSTNGTFVNGNRLQGQVALKDGDQVQIGKLAFQVVIREVAAGTQAATQQVASQQATAPRPIARPAPAAAGPIDQFEDTPSETVSAESDSAIIGVQEQSTSPSDTHLVGSAHTGAYEGGDTTLISAPPQPAADPNAAGLLAAQAGAVPQISAAQLLAAMTQLAAQQLALGDTSLNMAAATQKAPAKSKVVLAAPVVLPNPEDTGAPDVVPAKPAGAADQSKNPSVSAADIIRMHSQRRPKT